MVTEASSLQELRQHSDQLLAVCLSLKVLVRKRVRQEKPFEAEEKAWKKRVLERRRGEEESLRRKYRRLVEEETVEEDSLELEEKTSTTIQTLKGELFDKTVDNEVLRLLTERVQLARVTEQEAKEESSGKSKHACRFQERDELVADVLELHKKREILDKEELEVQREILAKQSEARTLWKRIMANGDKTEETDTKSVDRIAWLRQLLTTLVLEARINWASDPFLRPLILGEPLK